MGRHANSQCPLWTRGWRSGTPRHFDLSKPRLGVVIDPTSSGLLRRKFINFSGASSDEKYVPTQTVFRRPYNKRGAFRLRLLDHGFYIVRRRIN
jgi:hypothetical protein